MDYIYHLINTQGIVFDFKSELSKPKMSVMFLDAETDSCVVIKNGVYTQVVPIVDGKCEISLKEYKGVTKLDIKVLKSKSPLKTWDCDSLICIELADNQYYVFPNVKTYAKLANLRFEFEKITKRVFALEKKTREMSQEIDSFAGGTITE